MIKYYAWVQLALSFRVLFLAEGIKMNAQLQGKK